MSYTIRAMFPALLLSLSLTHTLPAMAADPAPASDAAAQTPAERPALLPREEEEAQALARRLPAEELQRLQAGSTEFLALWRPANTEDPQGAVIIVPGADQSPDWPDVVGPLRRKFPDVGWATLSLAMPDIQDPALQPREADASPASAEGKPAESKSDAPADDQSRQQADADQAAAAQVLAQAQAEQIFSRLDSAIAFARQNKARSIVLAGHGSGAYWAARYVSERPGVQVQKLVMIAASEPAAASPSLTSVIPALKIQTADFVYKNPLSRAAEERLQVSRRSKGAGYTQVGLVNMAGTSDAEQEQLFRRVRGWVQPEAGDN
ncbi:alpha/beta hydrolase family protein [Pseudomonas sp. DTU_2021_1001937_2_SI_NGA_ILE_001]|uniref:alpha/beta hydrolase family protein n=1 Tax=Pseudomonas sp. DTU_2021_1001937_2_SI_NGA_ILE_001 TaxID=3077589 RepID=UPI0028FC27C1|nr:alpha/beta hydrolase family protein [Pseudomonas sp. DTU_2021_1001937_2_SI_NGA_ILE_001]WNW12140.1 alpha/beta hydrolase family protein [Pseudomonas sp. DTU_2021_1001937_2_SI_NGA_ILE_001]